MTNIHKKKQFKVDLMQVSNWVKQFVIGTVALTFGAHAYGFEWQLDNHQALVGDANSDGTQNIYLQPVAVNTQAELPYDITLGLSLKSVLQNTLLEPSSSTLTLEYGVADSVVTSTAWGAGSYNSHIGDFNGDGLQDVLLQSASAGMLSAIVLGFKPSEQPSVWQTLSASAQGIDIAQSQASLSIQDVNGDGRDDIVITPNSGAKRVLLSLDGQVTGALNYPLCQSQGQLDSDCDNTPDRYDAADYQASNSASVDSYLTDVAIGSIAGTFNVTADGKTSYSIPLNLVPGVGAANPSLALSYSQSAGNGPVGVGWFINGLSEISRCPTTLDQDEYINGVNFNSSDQFCLNGQRLISIGGNEYRTENEAFAKIISSGSFSNGPASFTVWKADGRIETYGSRRTTVNTSQGVHTWGLSRSEDREGNYAVWEYHSNAGAGEYWIKKISYGGNSVTGQSADRSVVFEYTSRSDVTAMYDEQIKTVFSQRLGFIKTYLGAQQVRQYQLRYTTGKTGRSLVENIEECLGDGTSCLPKTIFTWDKGLTDESEFQFASEESDSGFSATTYKNQQYQMGDVNGDGKADLVWTYRNNSTLGRVVYLAKSDGTGFTRASSATENGFFAGVTGDANQSYLLGDVNGDGKSDLIWVARHQDTVVRNIYLANAAGTGFTSQGYEVESRPQYSEFMQGRYLLGDINGDGLQDLIWAYHHNNKIGITTYLTQYNNGNVTLGKASEVIDDDYSPDYYSNQNFAIGDVNGDGKDDLVWTFSYQTKMYRTLHLANANGSGFTKISLGGDTFNTADSNHQMLLGDVNGDRKADLIWVRHNNNNLLRTVYLASRLGTSFINKGTAIDTGLFVTTHESPSAQLTDINSDGRADLVYTYHDGSDFAWVSYLTNMNGEGFTRHSDGSKYTNTGTLNHEYRFADVSGDGKPDLVHSYNTSTGTLKRLTFLQDQSYPDHIQKITDGLANTVDIHYGYLADSALYTQGTATQYPYRNDPGLSYVVAYTEANDGIGGINRVDYRYKGARTHLRGRGFVGFEQRTVIDNSKGLTSVETYAQEFPFIGELLSKTVSNSAYVIQEVHNDWRQVALNSGKNVYRYLYRQGAIKRKLTDGSEYFASATVNTYNNSYGYLSASTVTTGRGYNNYSVSNAEQTVASDYVYNINTANWRIGFISKESKVFSAPGSSNRTVISEFTPYSSNSLLTKTETKFKGSAVESTRTYIRDDFGNITSSILTGKDISGGTITPQVGTVNQYIDGLYADVATNAETHTASSTYDPRYGTLLSKTDANGLITDTVTDGYGHALLERLTDGTEVRYQYEKCSNCPLGASYSVTKTIQHPQEGGVGAPEQVSYFDAYQRVIATYTQQPNNKEVVVETQYDKLGRTHKASQPYFVGATTKYWTTVEHDVLDRAVSEIRPDGGVTVTEYLGNSEFGSHSKVTATVKMPGTADQIAITHLYQNSLDQMRKSLDANNTPTEYEYDSQGNLERVTVNGNAATVVNITTDVAGNRTQLSDPDAGLINFEFDAAARERRRTYGSGSEVQTVTTTYDRIGRMKTRVDKDGSDVNSASWQYDPANGKGQLHKVLGDGYSEEHFYDALGRIQKTHTALLGESTPKVFHFAYDSFSRPLKTTYPTGMAVAYGYTPEGYKSQVINGQSNKPYWKATAWDTYGNVEQEEFGNGVSTTRQYTAQMGRIDSIATGNNQSASFYQKLNYQHDSAGNLRERESQRNNQESLVERFGYDTLNRLKSSVTTGLNSGTRSTSFNYDALGNIKTKSDVSDTNGYHYGANGGGVHALSSLVFNGVTKQYSYDFKGNVIGRGIQSMEYSVFNKPTRIFEATKETLFKYGPSRNRFYQYSFNNGTVTTTKYYSGVYEVVEQGEWQREKTYVDDFLVVSRLTSASQASQAEDVDYLHRDHLGSVEANSDRFGHFTGRFAFDAWGQRRADSWETADAATLATFEKRSFESTARGFTNHEHIDAMGLIHMGGRMYDPVVGRFLSPDDYVQFPENSQSYNRYSYVLNNPLSYTDPSGESLEEAAGGDLPGWATSSILDSMSSSMDTDTSSSSGGSSGETDMAAASGSGKKSVGSKAAQDGVGSDGNVEKESGDRGVSAQKERTWSSYLPGTEAGDNAAQYWADIAVNSDHLLAPLANVPGVFAALWTDETAANTAFTLGTAGTGGIWAAGSKYLNGLVARGIVSNPGALRFLPQGGVRGTLDAAGWAFKSVRASTASRGGWSRTFGRGPDAVLQWSAAGGRHIVSYWKLTGSTIQGTTKVPYFKFGSVPK